jgi:hypothetical protein
LKNHDLPSLKLQSLVFLSRSVFSIGAQSIELDVFLGLPQIDMLPFGINISIFCVNASDGLHVRFITLMNILLILGI